MMKQQLSKYKTEQQFLELKLNIDLFTVKAGFSRFFIIKYYLKENSDIKNELYTKVNSCYFQQLFRYYII